jgi:hypothetical protein
MSVQLEVGTSFLGVLNLVAEAIPSDLVEDA